MDHTCFADFGGGGNEARPRLIRLVVRGDRTQSAFPLSLWWGTLQFLQKNNQWQKILPESLRMIENEVIFNTIIKNLASVLSNPVVSLMSCYEKFNISKPYIPKQELNPAPSPIQLDPGSNKPLLLYLTVMTPIHTFLPLPYLP